MIDLAQDLRRVLGDKVRRRELSLGALLEVRGQQELRHLSLRRGGGALHHRVPQRLLDEDLPAVGPAPQGLLPVSLLLPRPAPNLGDALEDFFDKIVRGQRRLACELGSARALEVRLPVRVGVARGAALEVARQLALLARLALPVDPWLAPLVHTS